MLKYFIDVYLFVRLFYEGGFFNKIIKKSKDLKKNVIKKRIIAKMLY